MLRHWTASIRVSCVSELISPLELKVRERERERAEGEKNETLHCTVRNERNFTALEAPRQCPLVLLQNIGWKEGKTLGSEEGKVLIGREGKAIEWGR
jgi:hypothetical protein